MLCHVVCVFIDLLFFLTNGKTLTLVKLPACLPRACYQSTFREGEKTKIFFVDIADGKIVHFRETDVVPSVF